MSFYKASLVERKIQVAIPRHTNLLVATTRNLLMRLYEGHDQIGDLIRFRVGTIGLQIGSNNLLCVGIATPPNTTRRNANVKNRRPLVPLIS